MFQVTFSDQSMAELNKLGLEEQIWLVGRISNITPERLANAQGSIGKFNREGSIFYRLRAGDYRCYFTVQNRSLYSHFILHKNTLTDMIFRLKLPMSEEQVLEQHSSFWKYLESLTKK